MSPRTRNRHEERRRRSRASLEEDLDDEIEYEEDYGYPRNNLAWIVVVSLVGLGIFWLARTSNNTKDLDGRSNVALVDSENLNAKQQSVVKKSIAGKKEPTALATLKAMSAAYSSVQRYEDVARMQIRLPVGNQIQVVNAELAFKFERPNKLNLEVVKEGHRVVIVSDGEQWNTRIIDPSTDNFDNQFVVNDAENSPVVDSIYKAAEYVSLDRPNELPNALMSLPAPLLVSQIKFLLEPNALDEMINSSDDVRLLSQQSMQGHSCDRVRLSVKGESFVFWVDQQDKLLRRIQFPTADRQPGQSTSHLGKSTLQCDYARVNTPVSFPADTFQLDKPEKARLVRNFILPPQSDPNSPLNKTVGDFWFTDLRNERTPTGYWEDKLGVFVWWDEQPGSRIALESLANTYDAFKDDRRVAMLAVSSIPSTKMSHQEVQRVADQWDVALPVVRDLEAFGRDKFKIGQVPSVVITDRVGRVQLHELAAGAEFGQAIKAVVDKLLAGENLAEQYEQFLTKRADEYQELLVKASLEPPQIDLKLATPAVGPATAPIKLKISEIWANDKIRQPGNIHVVRKGLRKQLLVNSGSNSLTQLTSYGSPKDTIQPESPDGAVLMTSIRTAEQSDGRRFYLAMAAQANQVHIFDDEWRHVLTYPPLDDQSFASAEGVQDAQIADLDGDGDLELYVAFAETGGIHRVNWRGRREWTNQTVAPVLSFAISPDKTGQQFLLVTNDRGDILPLDAEGAPQKPITVPNWSVHHLFAAPANLRNDSGYCGVSQMPDGSLVAIGLSAGMSEQWNEPLSRGIFGSAIDFIQTATWGDDEQFWLIATPEGAVHIVSRDGKLHDKFQTGANLRGLAGFKTKGTNVLVTSTDNSVTAWSVDLP